MTMVLYSHLGCTRTINRNQFLLALLLSVLSLMWSTCFAQVASTSTASTSTSSKNQVMPQTAMAQLGRKIFFDKTLSGSGKLACASCHDPNYAYGPPPGKGIAMGGRDLNQMGTRAVPSLRYLNELPAFAEHVQFPDGDVAPGGGLTWDGRAASLHEQAQIPLLAANEMANDSAVDVARKLEHAPYAAEFKKLFGNNIFKQPNAAFEQALLALEAFQKTPEEFFPYSSKYDAFLRGEVELTDAEERGVEVFKDPNKGDCASCHVTVMRNGVHPSFTDFDFVNVGVPRNQQLSANADHDYYDLGLCGPVRTDLSNQKDYCGFFRAPTLRNVAQRDAFFHNGVFHTLREVLEFYAERDTHPEKWYSRNADGSVHRGDDLPASMIGNLNLEPPFNRKVGDAPALSESDIVYLLAFMQTLTDGYRVP